MAWVQSHGPNLTTKKRENVVLLYTQEENEISLLNTELLTNKYLSQWIKDLVNISSSKLGVSVCVVWMWLFGSIHLWAKMTKQRKRKSESPRRVIQPSEIPLCKHYKYLYSAVRAVLESAVISLCGWYTSSIFLQ